MESITAINTSAMLFNKIIVVYSQETESYLYDFNHHDLRAIETEKKGIIIPVSGENRRTRSFSRQNTRRISLKYARSLVYPTLSNDIRKIYYM